MNGNMQYNTCHQGREVDRGRRGGVDLIRIQIWITLHIEPMLAAGGHMISMDIADMKAPKRKQRSQGGMSEHQSQCAIDER